MNNKKKMKSRDSLIKFSRSIINPAVSIKEGILQREYSRVLTFEQHELREVYLKGIKIYSTGQIKDPVNDYESLKFLYELDQSLANGEKQKSIDKIKEFLLNEKEERYHDDFGKAKQHLGDVLYSYRKTIKITPRDILIDIGYSERDFLNMGILETTLNKTKSCVSSTVFEILVMDALPGKYGFIEKVFYCQDGAVKVKCVNYTGQNKHDYVIRIKDVNGNTIDLGFDSKAQNYDVFFSNLERRGFSYHVLTISSTPEQHIANNLMFKKHVLKLSESSSVKVFYKSEVEDSSSPESNFLSPLIPAMFVSTKDIAKNVTKFQKKALVKENDFKEDDDF